MTIDQEGAQRIREWFVPRFGTERFRVFVGLLFLPYTGMVLAYTLIGAMMASQIHWDRVVAIVVIYFFGLGIAAHALDALGSQSIKPWGAVFTRRQLWVFAAGALVAAYGIGTYYMVRYVPLLWIVAILEGFFVFAYNLELFGGRFHTDGWFAFSWGTLPLLAGYIIQTNSVSVAALVVAAAMGLLSLVEIKASRPYKILKRQPDATTGIDGKEMSLQLERILKCLSFGVILLGAGLLMWRLLG